MASTDACCLCGSTSKRTQYSYKEYDLVRCEKCGLGSLSPMPEIVPDEFYDEDYYRGTMEEGLGFNVLDGNAMEEARCMMDGKIQWLLSKRKLNSLLDIGCGVGLLVEAAARHGVDATGVDVSRFAIEYGREELGIGQLFAGLPGQVLADDAGFDVVYLNHVIEHVHNPAELVRQCAQYLKPGGWLVIETPDIDSTQSLHDGEHWEYIMPEHLYYFNLQTLSGVSEKEGLLVRYAEKEVGSPGLLHATFGSEQAAKAFYDRWLSNPPAQALIRLVRKVHARMAQQRTDVDYKFIKVVAEKA